MKLRIWDSLLDTGLVVSNCKLLEVERIQLSWWLRLGPSAATAHSFQSPFLTPELNNFHLIIPIIAAAGRCSLLPTTWMALTLSLITSWSPEMDVPIRPCPVQRRTPHQRCEKVQMDHILPSAQPSPGSVMSRVTQYWYRQKNYLFKWENATRLPQNREGASM